MREIVILFSGYLYLHLALLTIYEITLLHILGSIFLGVGIFILGRVYAHYLKEVEDV